MATNIWLHLFSFSFFCSFPVENVLVFYVAVRWVYLIFCFLVFVNGFQILTSSKAGYVTANFFLDVQCNDQLSKNLFSADFLVIPWWAKWIIPVTFHELSRDYYIVVIEQRAPSPKTSFKHQSEFFDSVYFFSPVPIAFISFLEIRWFLTFQKRFLKFWSAWVHFSISFTIAIFLFSSAVAPANGFFQNYLGKFRVPAARCFIGNSKSANKQAFSVSLNRFITQFH